MSVEHDMMLYQMECVCCMRFKIIQDVCFILKTCIELASHALICSYILWRGQNQTAKAPFTLPHKEEEVQEQEEGLSCPLIHRCLPHCE